MKSKPLPAVVALDELSRADNAIERIDRLEKMYHEAVSRQAELSEETVVLTNLLDHGNEQFQFVWRAFIILCLSLPFALVLVFG